MNKQDDLKKSVILFDWINRQHIERKIP